MRKTRKPAARGTRATAAATALDAREAGHPEVDLAVVLDLTAGAGVDEGVAEKEAMPGRISALDGQSQALSLLMPVVPPVRETAVANEGHDSAPKDSGASDVGDMTAVPAVPPAERKSRSRSSRSPRARAEPAPTALAEMPVPPAPAALAPLTPALAVIPQLLLRAQAVKVAFFDVDGVLTDGGLFFSEDGETLKRFNTLDGHGIKLLSKAGIMPAVVTGRDSPALRLRLAALGVAHVRYGTEDKRPAAESILDELGLGWSQAAWIGDDWPDLPAMRRCAFACAPANAHAEVKAVAHHVTSLPGGHGAAREFCDLLLVASGRYVELLQEYAA